MSLRPILLKLHRWVALATAPFFFLILLSGMVLAFKPILQSGSDGKLETQTLLAAIARADPNAEAGVLTVSEDGERFTLESRRSGPSGTFDVQTARRTGSALPDVFEFARDLHVSLLLQARWLVTTVTLLSVLVIASGFAGKLKKFRPTLGGWHNRLGWFSIPLVALTPLTGALMALHVGMPGHEAGSGARDGAGRAGAARMSIERAIEMAAPELDLSHLTQVRTTRGGTVVISVQDGLRPTQYQVDRSGKVTSSTGPGLVRILHEGTWAGAWSGVFTLVSTFPLLGLLVTGVLKWWRRSHDKTRSKSMQEAGVRLPASPRTSH